MNCFICNSNGWQILMPCCKKTICIDCFQKQSTSFCTNCNEQIFRTLPSFWFRATKIPIIESTIQ